MTYEEAKKRVRDLAERLHASASDLNTSSPALSRERERDGDAIDLVVGDNPTREGTCPTCGV